MPPPPNLDRLLELAGVLGADSAWLLRGPEMVQLHYALPGDEAYDDLIIHPEAEPGHFLWKAVLIVHFPYADIGVSELTEMKLPMGRDREIQAAALLSAAIDALSRMGPNTTKRVLKWAFDRYGIEIALYGGEWRVRDRRPSERAPEPEPPATTETTRLDAPADGVRQRRPGRPRKASEP